MDGARLLFVGAFTHDTLYRVAEFAGHAGKYLATGRNSQAAGMATAAATAAARWGGRPALWASLGDDALAPAMLAEIGAEGVDCQYVRRVPGGRSATAAIIVDAAGERWVIVDYDPLTQANPAPDTMPPVSRFRAVLADARWPGAARLVLGAARDAGLPAILDADVADPALLADLASHANHVVASATGAGLLTDGATPEAAAQMIRDRFGCFACVTTGAAGAFWTAPGTALHHVPAPRVKVVDTNAAGDVFHGAFALAIAEGQPPAHAVRFANAAAALKCTVAGGRLGAPDRTATEALMQATYKTPGQ